MAAQELLYRRSNSKDFVDDPYFWSGQHIRAKICQQVGEALGIEEDLLLDIAAFTELLHNASLIHDDLIDNDSEEEAVRHLGKSTVNRKRSCLVIS